MAESGLRISVLCDDLSGAPDEGVKRFALGLADAFGRAHCEVSLMATRGVPGVSGVRRVAAPKTFVSRQLARALAEQRPQVLVYVPTASTTLMACLRSRVLKAYCPAATVVLVGLQPRPHGRVAGRLLRYLTPDVLLVQATQSKEHLEQLGCTVGLVASGVDVETFQSVSETRRRELRMCYELDPDRPTVLHVGHLKDGRGIRALADLARRGQCQVVLVASSSTTQDADLASELRRAGVTILANYEPQIEHLYQLADCYVFPVASAIDAIEVPLSVLEALACDLPVVSTRFGGLPRVLGGGDAQASPGLVFVDSPAQLVAEAERLAHLRPTGTRALVLRYSWAAVASDLLDQAMARRVERTPAEIGLVGRRAS